MMDLLYVLSTLAFFALMAAYVKACDALGRRAVSDVTGSEEDLR